MGITQLLPLLSKSTRPCNIKEFKGRRVAVDAYCWLHKGATSCALELARGKPTTKYITYFMKYVNLLLDYRIRPVLVFDGRHLPAKANTEAKRAKAKRQAEQYARECLQRGDMEDAYNSYKKCIEITPQMALAVIQECRKINVDCIVAPYESDPQLAFFSMMGYVDCIISEDSDLLVFGCQNVLYKMDVHGAGQLVEAAKLDNSLDFRSNFSHEKFRYMCILSGCDYIASLSGIGLKKAMKFIKLTAENDPKKFLDKLPAYLNMRHLVVTDEYKSNFLMANATFLHQVIYDPFERKLKPLTPKGTYEQYCHQAGELFDLELAYELAKGNINPLTLERIDNWQPSVLQTNSIWYNANASHAKTTQTANTAMSGTIRELNVATQMRSQEATFDEVLTYYSSTQSVQKDVKTEKESSATETRPDSPVLSRNPFVRVSKSQTLANAETSERNSSASGVIEKCDNDNEFEGDDEEDDESDGTLSSQSDDCQVSPIIGGSNRFAANRRTEATKSPTVTSRFFTPMKEKVQAPNKNGEIRKREATPNAEERASFSSSDGDTTDDDFFFEFPYFLEPICELQVEDVVLEFPCRRKRQSGENQNSTGKRTKQLDIRNWAKKQ